MTEAQKPSENQPDFIPLKNITKKIVHDFFLLYEKYMLEFFKENNIAKEIEISAYLGVTLKNASMSILCTQIYRESEHTGTPVVNILSVAFDEVLKTLKKPECMHIMDDLK